MFCFEVFFLFVENGHNDNFCSTVNAEF